MCHKLFKQEHESFLSLCCGTTIPAFYYRNVARGNLHVVAVEKLAKAIRKGIRRIYVLVIDFNL